MPAAKADLALPLPTLSAATLVLETLDRARERGAPILAELVGYATNSDGDHVTRPNRESMSRVMRDALETAGMSAGDVGYVNAHGTATTAGDIAESHATHDVFGARVPTASLKGFFGHTLGACGALEAWLSLEMLRDGWIAPNHNLATIDPECADLDYVLPSGGKDPGRALSTDVVMSNNFAFGGINTSLIIRAF